MFVRKLAYGDDDDDNNNDCNCIICIITHKCYM